MIFNKKQRICSFKIGQWTLLRDDRHKNIMEKFDVFLFDPYVIKKVFANGSLLLRKLAGDVLPTRTIRKRCNEYVIWVT